MELEDVPRVKRLCNKIENKGIVDGLYYEIEGEGVPVLFINGGPGCTHHYFHYSITGKKKPFQVIYYDQRCFGFSEESKRYSVNSAVDDIEKLRKGLNIKKWVVMGHSYGGLLAQLYALKYIDKVLGLILCNSATGMRIKLSSNKRRNRVLSIEEREEIKEIKAEDITEEKRHFNLLLRGGWKKDYYKCPTKLNMARMSLFDYESGNPVADNLYNEAIKIKLKGKFRDFKVPTLIIEGEQDFIWVKEKIKIFKGFSSS